MDRDNKTLHVMRVGQPRLGKRLTAMTRIDGKKYFAAVEHELNLSGLAPDKVQQLRAQGGLKRGSVESRLGGRITRDLKYLSPTEVERRRELSEEFLKQPVEEVAEEGEA